MKGSLIIVGFFVLGIIVGVCDVVPAGLLDGDVSYDALCCLMFCVGISIGCDTSVLKSFRKVNPRLMMLPVMTILGTLAGCAAASLFVGSSPADGLSGDRFGIRILLVVEYLHHAISWTGVGYDSLAGKYLPRDSHPALCASAGKVFRQVGTDQCGRSHDDGYHVADYHPLFGRAFHHRFHLPWFLRRFLRAVPGNVLLFVVKFELYTYNTSVL